MRREFKAQNNGQANAFSYLAHGGCDGNRDIDDYHRGRGSGLVFERSFAPLTIDDSLP